MRTAVVTGGGSGIGLAGAQRLLAVIRAQPRTPVRRVGRPAGIAAGCAFLGSEDVGYITGQLPGVNGGRNT